MICDNCGRDASDLVNVDGDNLCDKCSFECTDCGEVFAIDGRMTSEAGDEYCESCYGDAFYSCESCGCEVASDDTHTSEDGHGPYCEGCYDEKYAHCEACGCEVRSDYLRVPEYGDGGYCDDCFSERYCTCDNCGCEMHVDNAHTDGDGCYCADCAEGETWTPGGKVYSDKTARMKSARFFGVELETDSCRGYEASRTRHCFGAKEDGSINGKEFISPPMQGDAGLEEIERFCKVARNWAVDKSCGYHLHLDMTNEEIGGLRSICYAYYLTARVWASFVSHTRRDNSYCEPIQWEPEYLPTSGYEFRYWAGRQNRYQWFNVASYGRHTTFEIRLHGGTLAVDKVANWVKAHVRFADWASKQSMAELRRLFSGRGLCMMFDVMADVWADADLTEYYRERAAEFGTQYPAPVAV